MKIQERLVNSLIQGYLVEPPKPIPQPPDESSLLSTPPQEIQKNIERWREFNERIHVVV